MLTDFSCEQWNNIAAQHSAFRQSWEWGEFQRALGRKVMRWKAENNALAAQIIRQSFAPPWLKLRGAQYFYIPRGPLILQNEREKLSCALEELISFLNRQGAIFLRLEPGFPPDYEMVSILVKHHFLAVRSRVQPQETLIIDLTKSGEEMLAVMHNKTRYNIRLAERHGVMVGEHGQEAFPSLWPMFEETARRDRFSFHSKSYYQKMLEILRPPQQLNQLSQQNQPDQLNQLSLPFAFCRLWVAGRDDAGPLAAAIVGYSGPTAIYLHGASTPRLRNLMAPHLLHWRIMQDAKNRGYSTYDFGGISEKSWPGVTRFKRGFGGKPFRFAGVFDLPFSFLWYQAYRCVRAISEVGRSPFN